ncbi:MAG: hypothetical protein WAT09_14805 [Paracoccaceae bacterium]
MNKPAVEKIVKADAEWRALLFDLAHLVKRRHGASRPCLSR